MNRFHRPFIAAVLTVGGILSISLSVHAETTGTSYQVKRGDTLRGLAKQFYNDVSCWPLIASIPANHAYYPGSLWIGKISVPSKEACDQLHHPLSLVGLKEISSKILANVLGRPWQVRASLASTYIEGHFRSEEERLSTYRVQSYLNRIKDNVSEWTMTWKDGGTPMSAFMDVTGLAESYLYRPYWVLINNLPLTKAEQENSAFWQERLKPYISDTSVRGAWEERHVSEYTRYLDGSHWAMNVPIMFTAENGQSYYGPRSFYVIDGKETETYYHAFGLALLPNGSWAFRYQQPDPSIPVGNNWKCEPEKNDVCGGPWFIKTNKTAYGPYHHPTPPTATADGHFLYFDITGPGGTFVLYRDGEKIDSYDWVDTMMYGKDAKTISFRARQGNTWMVVTNDKPGTSWNYVDQLQVNPDTGSVFYRARDTAGKWYAVKNGEATLVPWELARLLINGPLDEAIALRGVPPSGPYDFVSRYDAAFSKYGTWTFEKPVEPLAIDAKGNILFVASSTVRVDLGVKEGTTCSSTLCSNDYAFWLNDKPMGTAVWRMLPLFTKGPTTVDSVSTLPAFQTQFGKVSFDAKRYGAVILPAFDTQGHLVFYTLDDAWVKRTVFDASPLARF